MREIRTRKLAKEFSDYVNKRLEDGKWNFAVFYRGELVWSSDVNRVWCRLFKNYKFKTKHLWKPEAMAFEIVLKAEQDCWIDEIQISVVKKGELIYSRIVNIAPIHLLDGDTFNTLLKFDIKSEE